MHVSGMAEYWNWTTCGRNGLADKM